MAHKKPPPIPIAIVDDHHMVRRGLAAMVEEIGGYEVTISVGNGEEFVAAYREGKRAAIALVDLLMPRMDGFATLAWIQQNEPGLRAMAITVMTDDASVLRAYRGGARALLLKDMEPRELLHALAIVHAGGVYHSEHTHRVLLENPGGLTPEERLRLKAEADITPRAMEVLQRICQPDDPRYDVVGDELGIGTRTVESHVGQLFEVFGVHSKTALALSAVRLGIVKL